MAGVGGCCARLGDFLVNTVNADSHYTLDSFSVERFPKLDVAGWVSKMYADWWAAGNSPNLLKTQTHDSLHVCQLCAKMRAVTRDGSQGVGRFQRRAHLAGRVFTGRDPGVGPPASLAHTRTARFANVTRPMATSQRRI